ncbi:MAG: DUF3822 family protein [Saprospiraceae bacterium]
MEQRIFEFTDAQLSAETARDGVLNLILGSDGISLFATNNFGKPLALQTRQFLHAGRSFTQTEADIRRVFGEESLLSLHYSRVRCAFSNGNATLVPRRMFQADDLPAYFKMLLHAGNYTYGFSPLPELDCVVVYAVEPSLHNLIGQYFPNAQLTHLAATLLPTYRKQSPTGGTEVFLHLRQSSMFVTVFDRQNLLFYNAFQFKQASDVLYFTLLAFEQFRLDPAETPLTITGHLLEDSEVYRLLQRFCSRLRFGLLPDTFQLPVSAGKLPPHYFFDLYSLQPAG